MLKVYAERLKEEKIMQTERHVRLFRNGRNQALRIPREFELDGNEAIIRIIEPVAKKGLAALLSSWEPLDEEFPEIEDLIVTPEDIF